MSGVLDTLKKESKKHPKFFALTCIIFYSSLAYLIWKNLPFDIIGGIISILGLGLAGYLTAKLRSNRLSQYGMIFFCFLIWILLYFWCAQSYVFVYEIVTESPGGILIHWTNDFTRLIKKGVEDSDFGAEAKKEKLRWHKCPWPIQPFLRKKATQNQAALIVGGSLVYSAEMIDGNLISSYYYSGDQKTHFEAKFGDVPKNLQEKAFILLKKIRPELTLPQFFKNTHEVTAHICGCNEAVDNHLDYYKNPEKIGSFSRALDNYRKCLEKYPEGYRYRYNLGLLYIHHYIDTEEEDFLEKAKDEMRRILYGDPTRRIQARSGYFPAWMQQGNINWYLAQYSGKSPKDRENLYVKAIDCFEKAIEYLEGGKYVEPALEKRAYCSYANAIANIWSNARGVDGLENIAKFSLGNIDGAEEKLKKINERNKAFNGDVLYLFGYMRFMKFIRDKRFTDLEQAKVYYEKALKELGSKSVELIEKGNFFTSLSKLAYQTHYNLACVNNHYILLNESTLKEEYVKEGIKHIIDAARNFYDPEWLLEDMKQDQDLQKLFLEYSSLSGISIKSLDFKNLQDSFLRMQKVRQ
ncbi:MAG: hypothetical protein JRI72_07015 [Deltaproteobacteria bacterium]|nr:hypothetical protein [Deltaproteobacteria bacterium]